jgi:proteic killer suppression protein
MIQSFKDEGTRDVFNGRATRKARQACPSRLWRVAARKLDQVDSAERIDDLRIPPGNRLEMLAGTRKGRHSIRINEQYRICFVWSEDGPRDVEIVDYHD